MMLRKPDYQHKHNELSEGTTAAKRDDFGHARTQTATSSHNTRIYTEFYMNSAIGEAQTESNA